MTVICLFGGMLKGGEFHGENIDIFRESNLRHLMTGWNGAQLIATCGNKLSFCMFL